MRFWTLPLSVALGMAAATLAQAAPPTATAPASSSATPIFNGKDLSGWHGLNPHSPPLDKFLKLPKDEQTKRIEEWTADAKKHWSVENGELVNDGHGAYLATDKDYGDIVLKIEYKTVPRADSGIYLRGVPQVQIWDSTEEAKFKLGADKGSGALWNNSEGAKGKDPLVKADKPFGEWNTLEITQVGATTSVVMNGKLVVDHAIMENFYDRKSPLPARGPIILQTHGGEIRWRNITIAELTPAEANAYLAADSSDGFKPIFNGKSLDGWAGPVANYEVVDGAIRCKPHNGGTIYYDKELTDFVARVEFKLPPGGNNGLAIRYPGKGDTAYVGMCELQILDDTAEKYAKLDPRQYCGSPYGMVAAKRGYLRPVGEWNYEEVTVKGSKIKVVLNGSVIVDADLSTVKDYMANSPHPGKDRTSGFFGFAGHGDAVEFRNVSIKPLP
ncbi:MAG: DUF1080 domain-containing protein [Isosphaeraceae bacterium]